ncbi:MAG: hypothetical protein APR53_08500 [Methanoculleus sp. SDB]|nr:MAG: hypothetical protein APR53_08500 [Methanoculleus sp. SDB]
MKPEDLLPVLTFSGAEKQLARKFGIPADAMIPLFFSFRFGGGWCYGTEAIRTISVVKRTTVYDETARTGFSREEIFLFLNPVCTAREGNVLRLEKCGEEKTRLLVERPFWIRIRADRILKATVNPVVREIATEELAVHEMDFEGSTAANAAHELEHLADRAISGVHLWEFHFT